jgi:hypothetical protein
MFIAERRYHQVFVVLAILAQVVWVTTQFEVLA